MSDLTHVELLWLEKRIENWIHNPGAESRAGSTKIVYL